MQGDDIWVPDLLEDADLPLDVLPAHAPPAGLGPPFLDELGRILKTCTFLTTFLHNCKLSTGREKMEQNLRFWKAGSGQGHNIGTHSKTD